MYRDFYAVAGVFFHPPLIKVNQGEESAILNYLCHYDKIKLMSICTLPAVYKYLLLRDSNEYNRAFDDKLYPTLIQYLVLFVSKTGNTGHQH